MTRFADLPLRPSASTLRQFAVLCGCIFGGWAAWQATHEGGAVRTFVATALALYGVLGVLWPMLVRPVFVGWIILTYPLAWLVSHAVLGMLFFGVFTPLACLFRLLGRDVLSRRRPSAAATYWSAKPRVTDMRQYLRQF